VLPGEWIEVAVTLVDEASLKTLLSRRGRSCRRTRARRKMVLRL
jgi:hypothetical protein